MSGPVTMEEARARHPGAQCFAFGDGRALCCDLLARVRRGAKTATCGALRDYGPGGEALPQVGRRDVALDWDGRPALVIETVEVSVRRFDEVDADFALAEGEDDSLAGWQEGHRRYIERNGGWSPGMELVCERFRLVEDYGVTEGGVTEGGVTGGGVTDGGLPDECPRDDPLKDDRLADDRTTHDLSKNDDVKDRS